MYQQWLDGAVRSVPSIGDWVTICCLEDLYQIRDANDLAEAMEALAEEYDGPDLKIYETLADALLDLVEAPVGPGTDISPMARVRLGL